MLSYTLPDTRIESLAQQSHLQPLCQRGSSSTESGIVPVPAARCVGARVPPLQPVRGGGLLCICSTTIKKCLGDVVARRLVLLTALPSALNEVKDSSAERRVDHFSCSSRPVRSNIEPSCVSTVYLCCSVKEAQRKPARGGGCRPRHQLKHCDDRVQACRQPRAAARAAE
ncbi:hypothetical protein SFRURICE_008614 [Spodoptera frugiperda]|nr:hypothetical protein SFRURICE_008614 [Spodoptera frugiperda]